MRPRAHVLPPVPSEQPNRLARRHSAPGGSRRAAIRARTVRTALRMYPADDSEARLRLLIIQLTAMRDRLRQEVERSRALRARCGAVVYTERR